MPHRRERRASLASSEVNFEILIITYKTLYGQAPVYIEELLKPYNSTWPVQSI